jgi:hypothetical protein
VVATDAPATRVDSAITAEEKHPMKVEGDFAGGNAPTDLVTEVSLRETIEQLLNKHARSVDLRKIADYIDNPTKNDLMIFKSRDCSFVKDLGLSGMGVDDSELECISDLKLTTLASADNKLKDLHALKNMKTLIHLDVSGCPINKNGLAVISALPNIWRLHLAGTPISDSDLYALRNMRSLAYLSLYSCPNVTNQGISQLQKWLPKCAIKYGEDVERELGFSDIMRLEASLVSDGEYDEADLAFKGLIERWQVRKPVPYTWIIRAYRHRARCQARMNRNDEACRLYVTSLDICAKNAPDDPERPSVMIEYATLLEKLGRTQEAQNQRRAADKIWKEHPATRQFSSD